MLCLQNIKQVILHLLLVIYLILKDIICLRTCIGTKITTVNPFTTYHDTDNGTMPLNKGYSAAN